MSDNLESQTNKEKQTLKTVMVHFAKPNSKPYVIHNVTFIKENKKKIIFNHLSSYGEWEDVVYSRMTVESYEIITRQQAEQYKKKCVKEYKDDKRVYQTVSYSKTGVYHLNHK